MSQYLLQGKIQGKCLFSNIQTQILTNSIQIHPKQSNDTSNNQLLLQKIQDMIKQISKRKSHKNQQQQEKRMILGFLMTNNQILQKKTSFCNGKNLTQKWARKLFKIYKKHKAQFCKVQIQKIQIFESFFKIIKPTLFQFTRMLKQNSWFVEFLLANYFDNSHLILQQIYAEQKMNQKTKIILIQSYIRLYNGLINPYKLTSWNLQRSQKLADYVKISEKFENNYEEMLQMIKNEYEQSKHKFQNNTCSQLNNITYHWTCRIKSILNEAKLKLKYQDQEMYPKCLKMVKKFTINNIKQILSIPWLNRYIQQQKIANMSLLKDIVSDRNIHILNRKNLMQTYPVFLNAVKNPQSLVSWFTNYAKKKMINQ